MSIWMNSLSELAVDTLTGPTQFWPLLNDQYTWVHRLNPQVGPVPRVAVKTMSPAGAQSTAGSQQVFGKAPELPQVWPPLLENDMR